MQTNITARISWQHPPSDVPIIGYRVVWGQAAVADAANLDAKPQIEGETALTKVLSKVSNSLGIKYRSIESLSINSAYIIHTLAWATEWIAVSQ